LQWGKDTKREDVLAISNAVKNGERITVRQGPYTSYVSSSA